MRAVTKTASKRKPITWISMRHEADCWIAACAMAANTSYEDAETALGAGADYSAELLNRSNALQSTPPESRNFFRIFNMVREYRQLAFFVDRGFYLLVMPEINPTLKRGRRYLLSASSCDPKDPTMGHVVVVDEAGRLFDPEPKFTRDNPRYSIRNYVDVAGYEIVRWRRD
jgi:hypothetical protein